MYKKKNGNYRKVARVYSQLPKQTAIEPTTLLIHEYTGSVPREVSGTWGKASGEKGK